MLQVRIHVVIGKPIEVPQRESPTREEVQAYLDKFVDSMEALFKQYQELAGYADLKLLIV